MTRHGLPQFTPAIPPLRPTPAFAPSLVNSAANLPRAGNPHRQSHRTQRQSKQIGSRSAPPTAGRDATTLSRKQKYP